VLVLTRQSVRWGQASYAEHAQSLVCVLVAADGKRTDVAVDDRGELIRSLLRATVRREVESAPELVSTMRDVEAALIQELRRPSDREHTEGVIHAVTPLLAAIVS
jgi:hypothetical protein